MDKHLNKGVQLASSLPPAIAIVRALPGLGDLLCVVPALRALRAALPTARITLIGLPWAKGFVQRFSHYLDDWLEFPGYPGIPEVPISPAGIVSFLAQVQSLKLDLALQMHGNGTYINGFTQLLGAKHSAGFFPSQQSCPILDSCLLYPEHEPEVWRHLRLLEVLGIPVQGDWLEFPLASSDWQEWEAIAQTHELKPGEYICLHAGASVPARCWPPEQFAAVAGKLAAQGLRIVLTGTRAERELAEAIAEMTRYPFLNLAGQTSLGALAVLLKQARLLVCNDTGVSHLAAALGVNSVVIFSNSDPHRWAPLDRQRHRVVIAGKLDPLELPDRLSPFTLLPSGTAVLAEALDLLKQEVAYAS